MRYGLLKGGNLPNLCLCVKMIIEVKDKIELRGKMKVYV